MHVLLTHKTLPNVARTVDANDYTRVIGTVGNQPETFVLSEWTNHGVKTYVEMYNDTLNTWNRPEKSNDRKKRIYDALKRAGHDEYHAREISGYRS